MSSEENSASSPTKSDESPKNTIRVIKTSDADQTVVEVKIAGEDGAKVTVFGGDGPAVKNGTNKADEKPEPETNHEAGNKNEVNETKESEKAKTNEMEAANKNEVNETKESEKAKTDEKEKKTKDGDTDAEVKRLRPLTKEEIDKIVSKYENRFNKEDLDNYLKFFWSVDEYTFGVFAYRQLAYTLRKMGRLLTDRAVAKIFVDLDHDDDGLVSLDEFLDEMSREKPKRLTEKEMRARFEYCDKNHDGFICHDDIAEVLHENNVQYLDVQILFFLERNKSRFDTKLDYLDFRKILSKPSFDEI